MNRKGIGADLLHGFKIHFKMAQYFAILVNVAFLAKYNLIDKPARYWRSFWRPWNLNTSKIALQCFEQAHEIPNGKDVLLHEALKILYTFNLRIHWMR